jgi:hypothetical protein
VELIWRVQGGRGSPEQGVPRQHKSSGGEQRWWHGGATEGGSKGVEGVHGIGAEHGAVMGGSERGQSSGPRWLNDGKHGAAYAVKRWRRKKGVAPSIAARGGLQWRRELQPGAVVVLKLWARQSSGSRSPKAVSADKAADEGPRRFQIFLIYSKLAQF